MVAALLYVVARRCLHVLANVCVAGDACRRRCPVRLRADAHAVHPAAGTQLGRLRGRANICALVRGLAAGGHVADAFYSKLGNRGPASSRFDAKERRWTRLPGVEHGPQLRHVVEAGGHDGGSRQRHRGDPHRTAPACRSLAVGAAWRRSRLLRIGARPLAVAPAHPPRTASGSAVPVLRCLREVGHELWHPPAVVRTCLLRFGLRRGAGWCRDAGGVRRRNLRRNKQHDVACRLRHDVVRACYRRLPHRLRTCCGLLLSVLMDS
mmetsp:Transcript_119169/g.344715  ORF Transcript_119169/g.344715 Transcript_119169/m.344715 type:complete len:265 (+) Transcript_119169:325-1119(+)